MSEPAKWPRPGLAPLNAVPIALMLGGLLFVQGRLHLLDIAIQIIPLSVLFALITASSKYICRALPARTLPRSRIAVVHLFAAASTALLWVVLASLAGWTVWVVSGEALQGIGTLSESAVIFAVGLVTYLWSATVCYLAMAVEDAVRAENRAVESQCLALDAELKALRAKLHPHFLFNSLNSIAALTIVDAERARDMCIYLSEFLRHSLSFSNKREIRLEEELSLVRAYLAVEQIRFAEKMTVREYIADNVGMLIVPPLLLQPLIENAVKHGVAGMAEDGWIELRVFRAEDTLHIRLENPVDKDAPKTRGTGHGLAIVRERLHNLFGDAALLSTKLEERAHLLFVAELILPAAKESER